MSSMNFMELRGNFQLQKLLNRMGLLKGKTVTVQEAVGTMLNKAKLSDSFWREYVYTTIYILNRGKLRVNKYKALNKLWYGRPTLVKYFRLFGSNCYIKSNEDELGKFDSRTDEGIFLGYSSTIKEYRCYNKRLYIKMQKVLM